MPDLPRSMHADGLPTSSTSGGGCPTWTSLKTRGACPEVRSVLHSERLRAISTGMSKIDPRPVARDRAAERQRRLEAMHLQELEGNPLTADEVAMFEMFEREGWSHDRCRSYILERLKRLRDSSAAE